jgi:AcrR family transcriptional regulator
MPSTKRRPYTPRLPPEQRREQLLDAALRVIARDGYAGVSIDAIAREAGVTRPVVYGVFKGLGALLYALLDRTEERALTQLLGAFPEDVETAAPAVLVGATVRAMVETVRADPLTWRPILLAPEGTPDAVRERVDRDRDLVRTRIQALLDLGAALRPELARLDTEIAAHALVAVAEYFGRRIVAAPEEFDGERLARAVEALVVALGV